MKRDYMSNTVITKNKTKVIRLSELCPWCEGALEYILRQLRTNNLGALVVISVNKDKALTFAFFEDNPDSTIHCLGLCTQAQHEILRYQETHQD